MGNDYISKAIEGTAVSNTPVPQSVKQSAGQVKNSAGGFSFAVTWRTRLNRFLFLGTESGSYYASSRDLTRENVSAIIKLIESDGRAVVDRLLEVSEGGLALRQDPTLFVLALVAKYGDDAARSYSYSIAPRIVRTGTMMFTYAEYLNQISGWGRGKRRALAGFYQGRESAVDLAYQVSKYRSRSGWTHRDVLRVAHPAAPTDGHRAVYDYLCDRIDAGTLEDAIGPNAISGSDRAFKASSAAEVAKLVAEYNLSWEMIPTQFLNDTVVWDVLVPRMGYTALMRNLNRLTSNGWMAPASTNRGIVLKRLTDANDIARSRVHPFAIFLASRTYGAGRGLRGSQTWTPITGVTDALDEAFTKAFKNVDPTNKRLLLALDVSGSMTTHVLPGVSAMEASAALALITLRTEPNVQTVAFASGNGNYWSSRARTASDISGMQEIALSGKTTINAVQAEMRKLNFGGTDCSLPMRWAEKKGFEFDGFSVYTDSETWAGPIHPHKALESYRKSTGIPARSMVVGMVANRFTIADPNDPGMLDVVGLDASLPQVAAAFYNGEF